VTGFGSVAYIRWKLVTGKWWSSLVTSKSKITPKNRITIPRLELNGAVLSKRLKEFLVMKMDTKFSKIYHLVDSSTVLGYLHKSDSKLKPFEGIRVSEVQTSGTFVDGRLQNWYWVEGGLNPADLCTKPRCVSELGVNSLWQKGPAFLEEDFDQWPVKRDFKTGRLVGEILPKAMHTVCLTTDDMSNVFKDLLEKFSQPQKLFRIVAYMLKWRSSHRRQPVVPGALTAADVQNARKFWIRFVQQEVTEEMQKSASSHNKSDTHGRFRRLAPYQDDDDIWRIGLRMREFVPFTEDRKPPAFVPPKNRLTYLLMRQAHQRKHSGVEETVARFRMMGYWTCEAAKLAKVIKRSCVTCRILDQKPLHQVMGGIPQEQLINPVA